MSRERVAVERLCVGDIVQAVENGPQGRVVDCDRQGWTIVEYPAAMPYKNGVDGLYVVEEVQPA